MNEEIDMNIGVRGLTQNIRPLEDKTLSREPQDWSHVAE